jgi:hypothetical protein
VISISLAFILCIEKPIRRNGYQLYALGSVSRHVRVRQFTGSRIASVAESELCPTLRYLRKELAQ